MTQPRHWVASSIAAFAVGLSTLIARGTDDSTGSVPHGPLSRLSWTAVPGSRDTQAIIYRSPDGTRVAAAFRESGKRTFTYPFDEFGQVTVGTARAVVRGGPTLTLVKGDVFYFREGMTVEFEFSQDFEDVTMLVSTHTVKW